MQTQKSEDPLFFTSLPFIGSCCFLFAFRLFNDLPRTPPSLPAKNQISRTAEGVLNLSPPAVLLPSRSSSPQAFSISIFLPEPTARSHSGFPDSRFRVLLPSATYLLPESFPRILFLLAPPESTFRFHQNFLPFSLLFPESFSSQKSIPKPLSWDPSPHILFFSESLSTQGPCFSLVVPPRIFLFSGSTTPGNRLLPNLSSQPTVPRTTP